jgi:hypothetical protein
VPASSSENLFAEIEEKLRPRALPLEEPEVGDWLAEHAEPGQTFDQYRAADPVRRSAELRTLYLCLLGDFRVSQEHIVQRCREYLGLFFDVPAVVRRRVPLADIPARGRRTHPDRGDGQVLSTYVLRRLLEPDRPDDALAYLARTASDLWPGRGWNFVFGQANRPAARRPARPEQDALRGPGAGRLRRPVQGRRRHAPQRLRQATEPRQTTRDDLRREGPVPEAARGTPTGARTPPATGRPRRGFHRGRAGARPPDRPLVRRA